MLKTTLSRHGETWRRLRCWLPVSVAIALTLLMGTADVWAKGNVAPPAASAPAPAGDPDAETVQLARDLAAMANVSFDQLYGEREKVTAEALENFEGGDVVIITSTTLIIVLLVILILVLL